MKTGVLFLFMIFGLMALSSCQKDPPFPAKTIAGVWVASKETYFKSQSDSCTGAYAVYDSTPYITQWDISYLTENIVTINVTALTTGERIIADTTCKNAPPQYSLPLSLRGVVGSQSMAVEQAYYPSDTSGLAYYLLGTFYYTSVEMTGDLTFLLCDTVHCRGYMTRAGAIGLRKR